MVMRLGEQLTEVRNCPHCGIARPVLIQIATTQQHLPRGDKGMPSKWSMYACTTCGQAVLAKGQPGAGEANAQIVEIIPAPKSAHEDIPERARTFLQQAYETLHAPDAAGVMAGSAVDAMLKELGYTKGSLYERIDKAVGDHILTANMGEWAHNVRLGANRPRHADESNPNLTPDEAMQSVAFAEALGQFLFVLAAKVQRGIEASQQATSA